MNCKPGDIAVNVGGDDDDAWSALDNGRLVRVIQVGDDWSDIGDTRHHWVCIACDGMPFHTSMNGAGEPVWEIAYEADFPDAELRPIGGRPTQASTDTPRELEAA